MDVRATQPLSALTEQWRARRADLIAGCLAALDAANLVTHRYLPLYERQQAVERHVDALLAASAAEGSADPGAAHEQGRALAEVGFSDHRTPTVLRAFWVDQAEHTVAPDQVIPVHRFVHRYLDLFVEGFQRGRDLVILRQQEQMRLALEETLATAQTAERRLTRELQERLDEVDALNRLLTGQAWEQFSASRRMPREITWRSEMAQEPGADPASCSRFIIPLTLRGKKVAELEIEPGPAQSWTEQTEQLMRTLAPQLAQALDSARLFDETERRAVQLRVAAEVARDAAAILDLNQLLDETVELISKQFGFYHAGVFLVDEKGEYAILRAASSEGGHRMLQRGHKLPVGKVGIVGYVTATGEPRIALDVEEDAVHFVNPELPDTRSEMALPLRVRNRVIGALDVQSVHEGAFSDEDVTILQTMADQLATAIENARLLDQARRRARREQLIREITAQVRGAADIEGILRATVQEVGRALDVSHGLARLGTEKQSIPLAAEIDSDTGE